MDYVSENNPRQRRIGQLLPVCKGFAKPPFALPAGTGLSLDSYAFAEFFLDPLSFERTGAEEPVVAFYLPFGLVVHILALHRDDHLSPGRQSAWHGDPGMRVDGLQNLPGHALSPRNCVPEPADSRSSRAQFALDRRRIWHARLPSGFHRAGSCRKGFRHLHRHVVDDRELRP